MALAYWRREAIEVEVVSLLRDYGVSKYPIDIARLIKQIGIPMIPYESASPDERALFNSASPDAFSVRPTPTRTTRRPMTAAEATGSKR